ncbi:MAG: ThiF family adenylyltransferase [Thermomicrobiales bacterium]
MDGVTLLGNWQYHGATGEWVLPLRLHAVVSEDSPIPAESDWYVFASSRYPHGPITLLPAVEGGITATFPHQHANLKVGPDVLWRLGDICLDDYVVTLRRAGLNPEPGDAAGRLSWRTRRALDWLAAAASGLLLPDGAPFELPHFPATRSSMRVVFKEGEDTFKLWQVNALAWGTIEVVRPSEVPGTVVVQRFLGRSEKVLHQPGWGTLLAERQERPERGVWLRLSALPVLAPWQAPVTWGELRRLAAQQGIDFDHFLRPALAGLRDGRDHVMLLGFPISRRMGEPTVQMHWQAIQLPALCLPQQVPHGFRKNETGQWHADRHGLLSAEQSIPWLPSENWNATQISTRGRLPSHLVEMHVVVIGGGALGSVVAELLIRAGILHLTLVDSDTLQVGNLARHTLLLSDLGSCKATALATRLQRVNPNARVDAISEMFPPTGEGDVSIQTADLVIDATGSNEVAAAMAEYPWGSERFFASLSVGLGARRLYLYATQGSSFPHKDFRAAVDPLVAEDYERFDGELPWEGVGCWHPVFPARSDDIWILAAAAVKQLVGLTRTALDAPVLKVIEQQFDGEEFSGVRVR